MTAILFLGGSPHQLSPIYYAQKRGYWTIVCDNVPSNPGHKLADESHIVSTTDIDGILAVAKKANISGIVAYASDPAAPTAAYVAEKMGLPGNPYESVLILTHKHMFRSFLHENGFNAPRTYKNGDTINLPCVMKPVDSSGSKGVQILHDISTFPERMKYSASFSRSGLVIVEDYIQREGYQIAGDGFLVDGNLAFRCFANDHFDSKRGLVLTGQSFPCVHPKEIQQKVHQEIQNILSLLRMRTGAFNFEAIIHKEKIYIMEIGPRNGGTLIPEVTKYFTGVDMIAATVEAAVGKKVSFEPSQENGFYSSYMIHALEDGIFDRIEISELLNIYEAKLLVNKGDTVKQYMGTNGILGTMILSFSSQQEMLDKMDRMHEFVRVIVE